MGNRGRGSVDSIGNRLVVCGERVTTDQLPALDVRELKRDGLITTGQERVTISWAFRKRWESLAPGEEQRWVDIVSRLILTWTPCNYGGSRPWFVCPGKGCGRRVAILYGPINPLLCRVCLGLTYASQLR